MSFQFDRDQADRNRPVGGIGSMCRESQTISGDSIPAALALGSRIECREDAPLGEIKRIAADYTVFSRRGSRRYGRFERHYRIPVQYVIQVKIQNEWIPALIGGKIGLIALHAKPEK